MILRARDQEFRFPRSIILMGVVNVTPDSFSDGGRFLDSAAAIDQAFQLVEEGAEIIDIGGESTRPNAEPVEEAEELHRVMPVLEGACGRLKALVSIDTYKPGVARRAIEAGAGMINNVGAVRCDRAMWDLAAETGAAYVAMHMQGNPLTMQLDPHYDDVRREVGSFFQEQLDRLAAAGVRPEQIILDPGIGFGKRHEHNLELIAGLGGFARFERPLLLGVSRKSMLGRLRSSAERVPAGLGVAAWAAAAGVQVIRTHDVRATAEAVRMVEEILQYSRAKA
jgi:dihydropteroate synthase